ncbi:MAG: AMP-binding protein [Deinococcales bacterium]
MVHRSGGVMLKHHSEQKLHSNLSQGDRVFYFTTCGWMMWNWLVSALMHGVSLILFEGSPSYPSLEVLWRLVPKLEIDFFGTSARFIHSCKAAELSPKDFANMSSLKTIASTGSPCHQQVLTGSMGWSSKTFT